MKRAELELLDRRLKEEGARERAKGAFSPLLHERIMTSLRQKGLTGATREELTGRSPWWWRAAVGTGVAAAVAVGMWVTLRHEHKAVPQIVGPMPTVPRLPERVAVVAGPTGSAFERGKYAYLDHDAKRLFTFVADQMPGFPEGK